MVLFYRYFISKKPITEILSGDVAGEDAIAEQLVTKQIIKTIITTNF